MSKKIFLINLFLFLVLVPVLSQSAGLVPCGGHGEPKCQLCHFFVMIDSILDFIILRLTPVVGVLMLILGGVVLLFAGASPKSLELGKNIISTTLLGLVIIYTAWIVVNTLLAFLGVAGWTGLGNGGWSIINCPL